MKQISLFLLLFITITSCKPTKSVSQIELNKDKGEIVYYNIDKTHQPLVIVVPSVHQSLITEELLSLLYKKNRVAVIYFLEYQNKGRVHQIDNINRRVNYYSDAIHEISTLHGKAETVITEGLNSSVLIRILENEPAENLTCINAWFPSIKQLLISNCYSQTTANCDSLLSYLGFNSIESMNDVFNDIESKKDNLYGNYLTKMWEEIVDLNVSDNFLNYPGNTKWIYTTNTGLISVTDVEKIKSSNGTRKKILVLSKKEFYKNKDWFNN